MLNMTTEWYGLTRCQSQGPDLVKTQAPGRLPLSSGRPAPAFIARCASSPPPVADAQCAVSTGRQPRPPGQPGTAVPVVVVAIIRDDSHHRETPALRWLHKLPKHESPRGGSSSSGNCRGSCKQPFGESGKVEARAPLLADASRARPSRSGAFWWCSSCGWSCSCRGGC